MKDVYSARVGLYRGCCLSPPICVQSSPLSQTRTIQIRSGLRKASVSALSVDNGKIQWHSEIYRVDSPPLPFIAPCAALLHLPYIIPSRRPRNIHTSHMEEHTYMNTNMHQHANPNPPSNPLLPPSLSHMQDGRIGSLVGRLVIHQLSPDSGPSSASLPPSSSSLLSCSRHQSGLA